MMAAYRKDGWEVALLGDYANVSSGATPYREKSEFWNGNIPWITTSKICYRHINEANEDITAAGLAASSTKVYSKGTLLLAMYGQGATRGRVGILGLPAAINQACAAIEPADVLRTEYLYQYLAYHYLDIRNLSQGGNQANLSGGLIKSFRLLLPPTYEQEKIAAILHTWDRAIDLSERLITEKQERRKGLMQQLLTGKKRLPGLTGEWQEAQLNKVFERVQHSIHEGKTPEVLSITAKVGFVSQREKFSKVIAGKNLEKYVLIRRGEFSFNKGNSKTYPQGCVFRLKEFDEGAVPNVFYSFRTKLPEVCPEFYSHFFASGGLNHQLSRVINTGVRNDGLLNLKASDFFTVKIPLPPVEEQEQIAKILTLANQELDLLQTKADALRKQKKGLMQQLLTGKTRVKGIQP